MAKSRTILTIAERVARDEQRLAQMKRKIELLRSRSRIGELRREPRSAMALLLRGLYNLRRALISRETPVLPDELRTVLSQHLQAMAKALARPMELDQDALVPPYSLEDDQGELQFSEPDGT